MIANTIIKGALQRLLVVPFDGAPNADQYTIGLEVLNDMVNSWSAQNDVIYEDVLEELIIPSGTQSITIGSTGALTTSRPLKIRVASLKVSSTEYPMDIIDELQYARYSNKSSLGQPSRIYYRSSWPNGTIYFEFTTDKQYTLILTSLKQLSTFVDGTTDVSLPDHYERALKANLAIEISDHFGAVPTKMMYSLAEESKSTIIGQALDVVPAKTELSSKVIYNINADR